MEHNCEFCKIAAGLIPVKKVYEDERVVGFLDYDPIHTGHVLLVPRTHVLDGDELSDEDAIAMAFASRKMIAALKKAIVCDGYSLMQNGGDFNDVGHYHVHIVPREHGDGFVWPDGEGPKEYTDEVAEKIRTAVERL